MAQIFNGPLGMGEDAEEVQANVAAQVSFMVLGLKPGQTLIVERRHDDREMFRVVVRRGITAADFLPEKGHL